MRQAPKRAVFNFHMCRESKNNYGRIETPYPTEFFLEVQMKCNIGIDASELRARKYLSSKKEIHYLGYFS
jgi:hypothetical protein